eukprot:GHVQ01004913.1.p1 GENE.GHVQ01004913.1~~GHVQ01004913.1.p1  ORF type:complete len:103 (-),score=7.12 GHVQ01004913.1:280-588(-)
MGVPALLVTTSEDKWQAQGKIIPFAPHLPRAQEFAQHFESLKTAPAEELSITKKGHDGLRYTPKTGSLHVPPALREKLLDWFHASGLGGHAGVSKTTRRMKR